MRCNLLFLSPGYGKVIVNVNIQRTNVWNVELSDSEPVTVSRLILCTGSSPISNRLPMLSRLRGENLANPKEIDLDTALAPSVLAQTFSPAEESTVAVVGASHSAILVLMNLVELARTSHPRLRVKWFTRNKLRYAEYKDGWILRDNTGLKGQAADWARRNLDCDDPFPRSSPVADVVDKVWTAPPPVEEARYRDELPRCTHIVQAVGYARNPLPQLNVIDDGGNAAKPLEVSYDHATGRFFEDGPPVSKEKRAYVPGLFGAGIAFPERVIDPHGNVEYAVGFWKFMKFISRVMPEWLEERN